MARYYDTAQGRFISEDPAEDGLNWYAYCGNNPLRFVDPSGLQGLNIVDSFLSKGGPDRPGRQLTEVKAIVVHWTAWPEASAERVKRDWASDTRQASSQYGIGWKGEIVRYMPDTEVAYHAGGYKTAEERAAAKDWDAFLFTEKSGNLFTAKGGNIRPNDFTIGIEINPSSSKGDFTQEAMDSAAKLTAQLLLDKGLVKGMTPQNRLDSIINGDVLLRHGDITEKSCPKGELAFNAGWTAFKQRVAAEYESLRDEMAKKDPEYLWRTRDVIIKPPEPIQPQPPSSSSGDNDDGSGGGGGDAGSSGGTPNDTYLPQPGTSSFDFYW
jgi:N-acetylmuramoyl-L-alanine amidase